MFPYIIHSTVIFGILMCIKVTVVICDGHSRVSRESKHESWDSIVPLAYTINLIPYLDNNNFTFDGEVFIYILTKKRTKMISLNYEIRDRNDIKFLNIVEIRKNTTEAPITFTAIYDEASQQQNIEMGSALRVGKEYKIQVKYRGYLQKNMDGFFNMSYKISSKSYYVNERRLFAATNLKPYSARKLFPCFDDPQMKAKFTVNVARTRDRRTFSNMKVARVSGPDRQLNRMYWDQFEETSIPLSPHMISIVVSDFIATKKDSVSISHRSEVANQTTYGTSICSKLMEKIEKYTGQKYIYPKLDIVAIPEYQIQSSSSPGLLLQREKFILYAENISTALDKQNIAMTLAQQISYMWFGNIIDPKGWQFLWLSEGFAHYFKYFLLINTEHEWEIDKQFIVQTVHDALALDSVNTTHPLIKSSDDIPNLFDDITYLKGAAIIKMMEFIVTSSNFNEGIRRYFSNMRNQSAVPDDLYEALQPQFTEHMRDSSFNLKTVMDTWTLQEGYPVVTVERNYKTGSISASQKRFLIDEPVDINELYTYKWWIPLSFKTPSMDFEHAYLMDWLTPSEWKKDLKTINISSDEWIVFNIHQTGFYRVNYDETNWGLISKFLNSDNFQMFPPVQRAQILDDVFNLARAGQLSYKTVFDVIQYLERETNYIPWYAALSGLTYIEQRLRGASEHDYQAFKDFVLNLIGRVYDTLKFHGNSNDGHVKKLHRNLIMTWACNLGKYDCVKNAKKLMKDFVSSNWKPDKIFSDIKSLVYCAAARYSEQKDRPFILSNFYKYNNIPTEQDLILQSLVCSSYKYEIQRYITLSLNRRSRVKTDSKSVLFQSPHNLNPKAVDWAIDFFLQYYKDIRSYYNDEDVLVNIITSLSPVLFREDQLNKLKRFLIDNRDYINDSTVYTSLNSFKIAERNFNWFNKYHQEIIKLCKDRIYHLPQSILPLHYTLRLDPYFKEKNFSYKGEVGILISVKENTSRIVLHASEIEINDSSVLLYSAITNRPIAITDFLFDKDRGFYTIKLRECLQEGHQYKLKISFSGILRDDMIGFYKSSYKVGNETRWIAATQFDTTYARKAFPCFDEITMKATFKVSIARSSNYHVLSNMWPNYTQISSPTTEGVRIWETFVDTPLMPIYLLSFVISDFKKVSSGKVNVWQRNEAESQANYSSTIVQKVLSAFEKNFHIRYQLSKLDLVAIPDLSAVAMENWGLITFRERYLLLDETVSSSYDKQRVALHVAHEIAHQWFGDLVSPKSWAYTWLNEGFANYFQYFVLAKVEMSWRLEDQYVVHAVQKALLADAYQESRQITYDVHKPSQIPNIFDAIIYEKAGSAIRMMSHAMGEETFQKGLQRYIKKFSYNSVNTSDLAIILKSQIEEEGKHIDIEKFLRSWTRLIGYPVITVKLLKSAYVHKVIVTQERFSFNSCKKYFWEPDYEWPIPITYTTASHPDFNNTQPKLWMNYRQIEIPYLSETNEWLIFNIQATGYYRVNYESRNWNLIISQLNSENYSDIHVLNRAQLIDDALNLARAGLLNYSIALNLTTYLVREIDYVPWISALTAFSYIDNMLKSTDHHDIFRDYTVSLIQNLHKFLGRKVKSDDSHVTKLLRTEVLKWLCKMETPECVQYSVNMFERFMESSKYFVIPPDIASVVYCTAVAFGEQKEWDFLYNLYTVANVATEKVTILSALGCTKNKKILQRYLDLITSDLSDIRTHHKSEALKSIYTNPEGTDIVLNILVDNYETLSKYYAIGNPIGDVITGLAEMLKDDSQIQKLKTFIKENKHNVCEESFVCKKAVNIMDHNSEWLLHRAHEIENWLNKHMPLPFQTNAGHKILIDFIFIIIFVFYFYSVVSENIREFLVLLKNILQKIPYIIYSWYTIK